MRMLVGDTMALKDLEEAVKILKKQAIPTRWLFSKRWPFIYRGWVIDKQRSRFTALQIDSIIRKFL